MRNVTSEGYTHDADAIPECHDVVALRRFVSTRTACVARGVGADWPAASRWSLESLRDAGRGREVDVGVLAGGRLVTDDRVGVVLRRRDMGETLDGMLRGDASSYLMTRLDDDASLFGDVRVPAVPRGARMLASKLWVSPAGAVSPLHFDVPDNLHVQISGRKRMLVLPSRESMRLYPHAPWSATPNLSRVDPIVPDFARFPRLRGARRAVVDLAPGDGIFIPGFAWHHVTTIAVSISVNFWWASGALRIAARAADGWKRFRAINR